jgi:hypothetical protein
MTLGGRFDKFSLWAGLLLSSIGFSMLIFSPMAYLLGFLITGDAPLFAPNENVETIQVTFIIIEIGIAFRAHVLRRVYESYNREDISKAGWTSYGATHRAVSAKKTLGGAFENHDELYTKAMSDESLAVTKIVSVFTLSFLVLLTIGFSVAFGIVRYFMKSKQSRIERHMSELMKSRA